jgi:hypothetical protein
MSQEISTMTSEIVTSTLQSCSLHHSNAAIQSAGLGREALARLMPLDLRPKLLHLWSGWRPSLVA